MLAALAKNWPLLGVTVALIATYVAMAGTHIGDDGPRTFIAGLAAVCLGAWLHAEAMRFRDDVRTSDDDSGSS